MKHNTLTDIDVHRIVSHAINKAGTAQAFADRVGISKSALSKQRNARTAQGYTPEVLLAAGVKVHQPPREYYLTDDV
ncbi:MULTISPECIES: hypothetical protein [Komagataeibacter]|uniref:Uncharacterized protein n=1 Tax=Komagataeibacter oboediens TaxID=65958 RepID=A0A318QJR6_9PROT|nr:MULTISPECIES: hypothetical protein [Komagataeibacter]PYD78204.1 hypothetical protein CFR80_16835 [Komagataeibacter oboediens]GBQ45063.1 hypothetical protein AA18890_2355 [Komagataeibacter europaeus LMG 18890]GBR36383.1 hypothetical protein AA11826_1523 [Komagataeibacter oboediens DSM 11826]